MTSSHPRSPSPTGSTTGSITGKLSKLSLSNTNAPTRTNMSSTTHEYKSVKDEIKIDFFYGDRAKLRPFLVQLGMAFRLQSGKFPDSPTKVLFASTHLRGNAFAWFEPYISDYLAGSKRDKTKAMFGKWSEFEAKLKQIFGTVDEGRAAARMLLNVRQKGSAS